MRAWIASIIASSLGVQLVMPVAHADDDVERAAQVHLDRGVAAYGAGDLELALRELQTTVELVPHKPNPYRWLALTEIQLGDCAHARLDIDSFIARVDAADPRIAELIRARDACKQRGVPRVVGIRDREQVAPSPEPGRPLVTKWWFWTAVAVGAVAITGGILLTRDDGPTQLPGISCTASGCR